MKDETKFLNKKKDLVELINLNKGCFSKDDEKYINALLKLDVSVLNNNFYNEELEKYDFFKDLAIYNICKRNQKLINKLDIELPLKYYFDRFSSFIKLEEDQNKLFSININNMKKEFKLYNMYYHTKLDTTKDVLEIFERKIEDIKCGKYKNEDGSIMSYYERENILISLRKNVEFWNNNGDKAIAIYNEVCDIFDEDYNIINNNKELVRSLSFIDVYKKDL